MDTIESLCADYSERNTRHGLNLGSADEHLFDGALTQEQKIWLPLLIDRKMRHTRMPWTRKEEEELRALILSGKSVEDIAMKLNRTPSTIRNKAHRLKLLLKRVY